MLTALAFVAAAQASSAPPAPPPVRARLVASARIIHAVEVRQGMSSEPHQRRVAARDSQPITLIEFE